MGRYIKVKVHSQLKNSALDNMLWEIEAIAGVSAVSI